MDENRSQPGDRCTRCGQCCLKSSPTLHREDAPLLLNGPIQKEHLLTIRQGEGITDHIHKDLSVADREMIKVKEKNGVGGGCIFFRDHDKACSIYDWRPAQCEAFDCRDTREFTKVYEKPKLLRQDIVEDGILAGLIDEERCSYALLEGLIKKIPAQGEVALETLLDLLKFDYELRPFVSQKLSINPAEMDFYFGRPLIQTIVMYGLRVIREADGGFLLTT